MSCLPQLQQLMGVMAPLVGRTTGAVVQVPAFRHDVSDFVNAGLAGDNDRAVAQSFCLRWGPEHSQH